MKTRTVTMALGFIAGLASGWALHGWVGRHYYYETRDPLAVLSFPDGIVAILPKGTPIVGDQKVGLHSDVGWVGCVPIGFGSTPNETEQLVTAAADSRRGAKAKGGRYLSAVPLEGAGLKPDARFDIEGPSVKKPGS